MTDGTGTTCSSCGWANPAGQKFCGNCGASQLVACAGCGFSNPPGQRFCGGCGTALPITCPSCATVNPGGQKFCGSCGTPLIPAAAPPPAAVAPAPAAIPVPVPVPAAVPTASPTDAPLEEERRLITAIFCDMVGFTPLNERLDPEEVREIQTMYFAQMNRELHRFGGSVEKYAGDAVLALFGAPIAHEDDAERAVRCALAMQQAFQPVAEMAKREWGVDLAVRIGINTGEAISGAWDIEGKRDYSATGDVVNTAARLQSSADPGGVIVGPETMHLGRRAILFGPRKDLTLKGKATTFPAYPVLGLRDQMAERWETREQPVVLVGREHEVSHLMDVWERVQAGEGRIVNLVAEAGVGKSRLVAEVVDKMSSVAGTVVLRGRCLSFGEGMSLHLVAGVLRNLCQVHEGDEPEQVRTQVRITVDSLLAPWDPDTRDAAADVLGSALGLSPSPSIVSGA
jgi:adenylate cyclase